MLQNLGRWEEKPLSTQPELLRPSSIWYCHAAESTTVGPKPVYSGRCGITDFFHSMCDEIHPAHC